MSPLDHLLDQLRVVYPSGMPSLFRTLTGNRPVLAGFLALDHQVGGHGVLSPSDRMIVALITARQVDLARGAAAQSEEAQDVSADVDTLHAVLRDCLPEYLRARALVLATQRLIETDGRLPSAEMRQFARVGLDEEVLLGVIAVIAEFTRATHVSNLVRAGLDPDYRDAEHA